MPTGVGLQNPAKQSQIQFCMSKLIFTDKMVKTWGYDFVQKTNKFKTGKTVDDYIKVMKSTVETAKAHKLVGGCVQDWDSKAVTEWTASTEKWKGAVSIAVTGLTAATVMVTML